MLISHKTLKVYGLISLLVYSSFSAGFISAQSIHIKNLKCEYLENPIGIDNMHPRFTWQIDDSSHGVYQTAYQLIVGTDSSDIAIVKGSISQTNKIISSHNLAIYSGKELRPFTKYYWKVAAWINNKQFISPVQSFETGMLSVSDWKGSWISDGENINLKPAPYFRKEFDAAKSIKSARAYITAAGLYELYINGKRIGDHRLDPAFTRFDRRTLYVTYDITQQIQSGKNAIGVILGNGWYNFQSQAVWDYERAPWRNRPAFCMDLRITYTDGTEETISSDRSWKTSLGPIVYNSIYTGEHYDARLEQQGWNEINYDDGKWKNAIYRKSPAEYITAEAMQPIRNVEEIGPVSITKKNDSDYIFNLDATLQALLALR
ncbi:MAG: alpha-L-rhamnosidase N-terminal domain-containing protein [Arachidicoccus sp.]|nr:alpha-L-rhamnosidase N-terminal domain-containing protein [Arachidicoccus sp.]